jgi:rubrerythrin
VKVQPNLETGGNRTGIEHARDGRGMLDMPSGMGPTSRGSSEDIARVRNRYARAGLPTGTMPPDVDRQLVLLVDLLGARLAFERGGVRFYDALIAKLDSYGSFDRGPSRRDLEQIREDEHRHVVMLDGLLHDLGADPTVFTPCANREVVSSRGIGDVLLDPRTSLLDGLESIVIAELADHEQWMALVDTTRDMRRDDLARLFIASQATEEEHLSKVRRWLSAGRAQVMRHIDRR